MNSPDGVKIPALHEFGELYKLLYAAGRAKQMPKHDRYGLWRIIEQEALTLYTLLIEAAFATHAAKAIPLAQARVKIEILKRLIRLAHELEIIEAKRYLELETRLISISRQVGGWSKFVQ